MNGRVENDLKIYKNVEKSLFEFPSYIADWYYYLKANGQSAMTCRDYIHKIKLFLQFINAEIKSVRIEQMDENIITRYFIKIQYKPDGTETSDSYKQCIWSCLNNFFEFLEKRNYISKNLIVSAQIKRPKNKDLIRINNNRKLLTQDDFNKIINAVENGVGSQKAKSYQKKYKNRDMCIMLLFMTTGIRKTALSEINMEDINLNNRTLYVMDKGHILHEYYINDKTLESIEKWMLDRCDLVGSTEGAFFISRDNTRMSGNSITKLVDKYAYEALGYHISPHKLRSGLVSIMYEQTHDVEFCRRVIGHSNVSTTQRYIVTNNREKERAANMMDNILTI